MTNKNSDWSEGIQPLTIKDIESLTINDNPQLDLFVDDTMNSSFDYSPSTSVDLNDVFVNLNSSASVNLNSSASNFDTTYSLSGAAQPTLTIGDLGGIFTNPLTTDSNSVSVKGNLNVTDGHINLDGKSLSERLAKIEERIGVLIGNPHLEEDYEKLKKLGNRYRRLEKKLLSQNKTWDILKRDDDNA